jgi:alpha-beta hydrolase superfamily lysophospholipase
MPNLRAVGRRVFATLLRFLLVLSLFYVGLCWIFWVFEPAFVFARVPRPAIAPESAGLRGFSEVHITTEDGAKLYGWWGPPRGGGGVVLLFTGTGVTIADYASLMADFAAQGFGVLGIDYRGNGASPGIPTEAAWRADARAAYDYAHATAPRAKIVAYGQSMGTGFAVMLAFDRPAVGVLLDSAYASVARLFERDGIPLMRGIPLPARLLMNNPIDAEKVIGQLRVPVLMLHGTEDRVILPEDARRLYAAAREPKELIEVEGAGHAGVWFGPARDRALAALAKWTAP